MDLKQLLEEREKLNAEFAELGKRLFKEFVEEIFDKHPDLHGIRWTQYTPYWNDGEPCVFEVHEPEVLLPRP